MRNISKIAALLLAAVFVFSACNAAEPEIVPEYETGEVSDNINLGGYQLVWGYAKSGAKDENVFGYIPGTAFADMALQRKKDIEKESVDLDVNLVITKIDHEILSGSLEMKIYINTKKNGALMECHFFVRSLVKLVRAYPPSINPEYDSGITNGENK